MENKGVMEVEIDRSKKLIELKGLNEEARGIWQNKVKAGETPPDMAAAGLLLLGIMTPDNEDGPFPGYFQFQWSADDVPHALRKADRLAKVVYTRNLDSLAEYESSETIGAPVNLFIVLFECIRASLKCDFIYLDGEISGETKIYVA